MEMYVKKKDLETRDFVRIRKFLLRASAPRVLLLSTRFHTINNNKYYWNIILNTNIWNVLQSNLKEKNKFEKNIFNNKKECMWNMLRDDV